MTTAISAVMNPLLCCGFSGDRVLLLDYDGTLAPFVENRNCAYPHARVPELLDEIAKNCRTRVAIITGRAAEEIPCLLKTSTRLEVWGCHGLERFAPDGSYWRESLSSAHQDALDDAVTKLKDAGMRGFIETKTGSVAVHWRGLSPAYTQHVKGTAYKIFSEYMHVDELHLLQFEQGIELRVSRCNKGTVVQTILKEASPRAAIAYLGDDTTDEDAFRELNGHGLTILVRPTYRFTAAKFWLRPPDELIWFLHCWIDACMEGE